MEIKEIRHHYVFLEDKAISFGFRKNNEVYFYSHDSINKDMKFLFEYKEDSLFLTCIDKNFNDTFLPFEGNGIKGDFVTSLRKEASSLLGIIKKSCFEHIDIEKEILIYVEEKYKTKPSYPFEDKKTYVFRKKPSRKWFALIQTINLEKLGLEKEDGKIMNLKADTNLINSIIDNKNIFPAYHMNKKHWISIYLDKHINIDKIKALLDLSYSLVV